MTIVLSEKTICNGRYHAEIRQDKEQHSYTVLITADGQTIAKRDYTTKQSASRAIKNLGRRL
jgi:uncharacterized protein YegP (UPF0339 family)